MNLIMIIMIIIIMFRMLSLLNVSFLQNIISFFRQLYVSSLADKFLRKFV